MKSPSPFQIRVAKVVRKIPPGTLLSYSRVAMLAGRPGAPRAVVQALKALEDVPWWRVGRADGTLAPEVAKEQARRLKAEGAKLKGRTVLPASKP